MTKADVLRPGSTVEGLNPLIAGRWSSRAIDGDRPVPPEVMERLYEAARWAPSAMNFQPWRFMAFGPEAPEALNRARSFLSKGNAWALKAPRLLYILTRMTGEEEDKPRPRGEYEAGMAAAQMALQAAQEGLFFHQMAGFDREGFIDHFSLPREVLPIVAAALGYPGFAEDVPEKRRAGEWAARERKAPGEIVFHNGRVPPA